MNFTRPFIAACAIGLVTLVACSKSDQDTPHADAPVTPEASANVTTPGNPSSEQRYLVRVCTLNDAQAVRDFQNNVALIQQQRVAAANLQQQLRAATDPAQRAQLETQLSAAVAKLNENNRKMAEIYRFSLNRNYILVNEVSSLYARVSDAEAQRIVEQQRNNPGGPN